MCENCRFRALHCQLLCYPKYTNIHNRTLFHKMIRESDSFLCQTISIEQEIFTLSLKYPYARLRYVPNRGRGRLRSPLVSITAVKSLLADPRSGIKPERSIFSFVYTTFCERLAPSFSGITLFSGTNVRNDKKQLFVVKLYVL